MNVIESAAMEPSAMPSPTPVPSPSPAPMRPDTEVTWASLSHLSWVVGSVVGLTVIGPLVAWLALRDRGPFVRHHTTEALNANISYLIYTVALATVTGLFTLVTFGLGFGALFLVAVIPLVGAVLSVVAAVAAGQGRWYRYPLVLRFVR